MYEEKEPAKKVKKEKVKREKKFFTNTNTSKEKKEKETKTQTNSTPTEEKKKSSKILSFRADYVSVLVRFGIFLVFAFVVIFIVTKVRNSGDAKTFTENMEKMKEVAYVYYKVEDHRPINVDEEVVMTLKDMEDASLITELKDKNKTVCSKEYSYVSLTKRATDDYDLTVYLSCGGEAQTAIYPVQYEESSGEDTSSNILYELKRTVTSDEPYSCPEGYYLSGRYCFKYNTTDVISATPKYKVTPAKNTAARYKASGYTYEYIDPVVKTNEASYECPSGYTLNGNLCTKEGTVKYKNSTIYSCPNGGTPSGSRCLFTTYPSYSSRKPYCRRGSLVNGSCYVTKDYSFRCLTGTKDSTMNSCYITYSPKEELSDWLLDGKVTYSEDYDISRLENEKRKYEVDEYLDNGRIRYNRYIRKYIKQCDAGDELRGSTCRHYDDSYVEKYCSNSDYHLTSDGSECYTLEDVSYKETNGSYVCPSGYNRRGNGADATCYKYEAATKSTNQTPYCSYGYDLTQSGKCLRTIDATLVEENVEYSCPAGYTKRGSGSNISCYKKTSTDSYYYCTNPDATLNGTRCIVDSKTTILAYSCPLGYDLSGNQCIKENVTEHILATENDGPVTKEEVIWSKTKDLDGWTWTGNTKEA